MQCDDIGPLLSEYQADTLAETGRRQVAEHLERCADCRAQVALIAALGLQARQWSDLQVPNWHRTQFSAPARPPRPWLAWLSLATSALALLVVMFQLSLAGGLQSAIQTRGGAGESGAENAPQVAAASVLTVQELEQRLALFEQGQQLRMSNQLAAWNIRQQQDYQQFFKVASDYVSARQQEQLTQWTDYWKLVRERDQAVQTQFLNELYMHQQQNSLELDSLKASLLRRVNSEAL